MKRETQFGHLADAGHTLRLDETVLRSDLPSQPWQEGYDLGKGINAVTGNIAATALTDSFKIKPATERTSTFTYSSIMSSSDVSTEISASLSGSYNLDGVNLSASTSFVSNLKQSDYSLTVLATYDVYYSDYDQIIPSTITFSPQAGSIISKAKETGDWSTFRNIYGDYFISGKQRQSSFQVMFTVVTQTQDELTGIKAKFGADTPKVFTVEGQTAFQNALSAASATVNMYVYMQGYQGNPPNEVWNASNINILVSWIQDIKNQAPIAQKAELKHYSQIDPEIPVTLPIDPSVFGAVSELYVNTYLMNSLWGSLPDAWQSTYQGYVTNLTNQVSTSAQSLVEDNDLLEQYSTQVATLSDTLMYLNARDKFLQTIYALQSDEPSVNKSQSNTGTFGTTNYISQSNDPGFLIQSTSQQYSVKHKTGHRVHYFDVAATDSIILKWQVQDNWNDGTNGDWYKLKQDNNSEYILGGSSAKVKIRSQYDRGMDFTLTIWYVDASLFPPATMLDKPKLQQKQAANPFFSQISI